MDDAVELSELIGHLRDELSQAVRAGAGRELRFEPGPIELELTVGVHRDSGADGKVRLWVLDMASGRKRTSTITQRIKLTLTPHTGDAPDRTPLIHGEPDLLER
ncbi:trypco2 family protein [Actinoplanes sp. NPDC051851]|uniref:trypco2 family protein n=1 Tax=Actinoplanes sp. NPDC051851 TaxID=3154753 RepID=UPI00341DE72D